MLIKIPISFFLCFTVSACPLWGQAPLGTVPPRIASLNACTDELLLAVADRSQIAGLSRYPLLGMKKMPKAESSIRSLSGSAEEVLAIKPDIVLATDFTRRETLNLLRKYHYRVEIFSVPETLEGIVRDVRRAALLAGQPERGEQLAAALRAKLENGVPPESPAKPRVLFFGVGGHIIGAETLEDSIIRQAGGVNLAAEAGIRGHGWLSLEALIGLKPDALFLMSDEKTNSMGEFLLSHPAIRKAFPHIPIEKLSPGLLDCGTPDAFEAVEQVRGVLRRLL